MTIKQATLFKLAQVRCAINHVLRVRGMQKQAAELYPWSHFRRYENPEDLNYNWMFRNPLAYKEVSPHFNAIQEAASNVKNMNSKRDPTIYDAFKGPHVDSKDRQGSLEWAETANTPEAKEQYFDTFVAPK